MSCGWLPPDGCTDPCCPFPPPALSEGEEDPVCSCPLPPGLPCDAFEGFCVGPPLFGVGDDHCFDRPPLGPPPANFAAEPVPMAPRPANNAAPPLVASIAAPPATAPNIIPAPAPDGQSTRLNSSHV